MTEPLYSREQIQQWQQNIEQIALKPRTSFSKSQAIEELFDSIEKALEQRTYSYTLKYYSKYCGSLTFCKL